ncbi:amino acid transporter [Devosia epidermidihirudinis]|uniref:Amino acid transporter n=1 Tax=Devosia epidermidihirudinis TaxID=1293439 RepID=A0A0F5QAP0_9HYPH|nr:LysE/ArgO family amino acid transporter [Devosia epidermidihirudinis]KKC38047.1 amino acid transporter [Devosia epidermidihirudinis]
MDLSVYATGLMMGLSLIVAIGAQNAFVLRQGLQNQHVLAVCLTCAVSDAILIAVGVTSFRTIGALLPWLDPVMRYGGAAFLFLYGAKSLYAAFRHNGALGSEAVPSMGLWPTIAICLSLTWLNPHVYLDTVMLLGTVSSGYPGRETSFMVGAITASFAFFFALGYGATWLRPVFAKPAAWRVLEALIAITMWAIAIKLLIGF